jgi:potassium-dependent mechanosensitive channel
MLDPTYLASEEGRKLLQSVFNSFNIAIVQVGGIRLSLVSGISLIVQAGCVMLLARLVKQLTKKQIFKRFGLESGARESLSSLASYVVSITGFLFVLDAAGVSLSSLAVFAGAIGIAIGIGLQNLANNFISGIILLLEQPICVGDFIEIDTVAGVVERISLRSTLLRTGRGLSVIVPNSNLANNSLINWSHRDPACAIGIKIEVADTNEPITVTEALLAAARQEPSILSTPSPLVLFRGIENRAFQFELSVWINEPARRVLIESTLFFLVQAKLQEYGIVYPARGLFIKSDDPEQLNTLINQFRGEAVAALPAPLTTNNKLARTTAVTLRDLLRKVSYFANLNDIELRHIIEEGYQKRLRAGEVICRENDPGDSFYIILAGSVDVFVESMAKQVAVREVGEFIGEMSLLMGTPRTATLQTLEETTLFVVDRSNLQSLLRRHQELADKIAAELTKRRETLEQLGIKFGSKDEPPLVQIRKRIQLIFGI